MTKPIHAFIIAAMLTACFSNGQSEPHPREESAGQAPLQKPTEIFTLGDCRYRINSLASGILVVSDNVESADHTSTATYHVVSSKSTMSNIEWGFSIQCVDSGFTDGIAMFLPAKQSPSGWVFSPGEAGVYGCDHPPPGNSPAICEMQVGEQFSPNQHFTPIEFSSNNWVGTGFLIDEIHGEEPTRARELRFCLTRNAHALCGTSYVSLINPKQDDVFDDLMKVLHSISFMERQESH